MVYLLRWSFLTSIQIKILVMFSIMVKEEPYREFRTFSTVWERTSEFDNGRSSNGRER